MDTDILVISNNESVNQLMQMELSFEGYRILIEKNSTIGFITARKAQPRLLILDMAAPGLPAIEICNRLQAANNNLRIMLLTDINSVQSTELLVDDYIFCPLSLTELLLRVKLNLRQHSPKNRRFLGFKDLLLNLDSREVYRGERPVELPPKEFDLLTYLLRHPQQVIDRDRLLEEVWDYDFSGSHNVLHVCIRSLRNKLEADGETRLIQTVRGVGYVLKASSSGSSTPNPGVLVSLSR
ncbi:MAG: response regulator transcription factor [Cyanobacteria bacterium J06635_15]